jgi:hypothetical protein
MVDDAALMWVRLRDRRSSLRESSLLNNSSSRAKTFAAAMQQFEEQMSAAKVVTPATRPINLYYGMTQAGVAISAVHKPGNWSAYSHGLTLDAVPEIVDIPIWPDGSGAYQIVSEAVGSPLITGKVTIGALWASLPELGFARLKGSGESPGPLDLYPGTVPTPNSSSVVAYSPGGAVMTDSGVHEYYNSPEDAIRAAAPTATLYINDEMPKVADAQPWLARLRELYPSAHDADFVNPARPFEETMPGQRFATELKWPLPTDATMDANFNKTYFREKAPQYVHVVDRYLRPSVEKGLEPPSPMMTWWLLLYAFSILARYAPRKWVDALNPDAANSSAAALQYALDTALERVPHLVLEALDKKSWLLPKAMQFWD